MAFPVWRTWKKLGENLTDLPALIRLLNTRLTDLSRWTASVSDRLDNQGAAMPVAGAYTTGFFQENTAPVVLGLAGSRYTILGWKRLTTSSNHVLNVDWVEARALTGT